VARYKVLKSVAHSLGHSYASTLNYDDSDYVMGHLLSRARETSQDTLTVDLATSTAAPDALLTPPVQRSVQRFSSWLPHLVRRHFSDMKYVSAATMTITFDLSLERPNRYASDCTESPFVIRVNITDDRGKVWSAEQRDWWFPEPPPRPGSGPNRRTRWLKTLRDRLWRFVFGGPLTRMRSAAA